MTKKEKSPGDKSRRNTVVFFALLFFAFLFILEFNNLRDYQGLYADDCWEYCLGGYLIPNIQCGCDLMPVSNRADAEKVCVTDYEFYVDEVLEETQTRSGLCYLWDDRWCLKDLYSCYGGVDKCPTYDVAKMYYDMGSAVASITNCIQFNETYCRCKHLRRTKVL